MPPNLRVCLTPECLMRQPSLFPRTREGGGTMLPWLSPCLHELTLAGA